LIVSVGNVIAEILIGEMGQAAFQFDTGAIISFILLFTAVVGIRAVFSALNALFLGRFAGKAGYRFRKNFAAFFIRRPFSQFERVNSGEKLSIFTADLPFAIDLVAGRVMLVIADTTLLITAMAFMFYMNWLLTLIFIAMFPLFAALQAVISTPIQKTTRTMMKKREAFNAVVNDSLQNTATIIAYNLEDELEERYIASYAEYYAASVKRIFYVSTLQIGGSVIATTPLIFLFIASAFAVVNGDMDISGFIAFTAIGMTAAGWLMSLAGSLGAVRTNMASAERLNEAISGDIEEINGARKLTPSGAEAVSFENVTFAYTEDGAHVLQDVSFTIPMGAKVAIAGGSGSGKSTVLKLLLGLYEPKEGKISVLGNEATAAGKYALRESFAYVPQDSFLFPYCIGENITGKKEITTDERKRMEKACRDAGIWDFIDNLPNKFDNILSESAENISGGQKQRIAMARAFYKDAPIILFDEATSALDPTTEAEILKTLEHATKDKTLIMVAHRATAKAFCDTVITLEGGRIV